MLQGCEAPRNSLGHVPVPTLASLRSAAACRALLHSNTVRTQKTKTTPEEKALILAIATIVFINMFVFRYFFHGLKLPNILPSTNGITSLRGRSVGGTGS